MTNIILSERDMALVRMALREQAKRVGFKEDSPIDANDYRRIADRLDPFVRAEISHPAPRVRRDQ